MGAPYEQLKFDLNERRKKAREFEAGTEGNKEESFEANFREMIRQRIHDFIKQNKKLKEGGEIALDSSEIAIIIGSIQKEKSLQDFSEDFCSFDDHFSNLVAITLEELDKENIKYDKEGIFVKQSRPGIYRKEKGPDISQLKRDRWGVGASLPNEDLKL